MVTNVNMLLRLIANENYFSGYSGSFFVSINFNAHDSILLNARDINISPFKASRSTASLPWKGVTA